MSSRLQESVVGRLLDGRYRVLSHLADGGMASVYLALDERLDREVAVKIMRRDLAQDETFVSRFRREARSAARLSHPNVVAVFDQGEDAGDMFLAMEYVPGRTLREVLVQEGPLTPRAALDLFDPILQALDAAHAAGLIHRDVKPENVILREDGVVKVADFGLARAVTTATTTNASGVLLGTVAYLSPEQVERGIADARSDVYAVGLVLYEMLTGRKAFDGDTPIHVAYQHVHGSVPVPSDHVRSVPQELDQLVALGTARDPDQRPASAGDYLAEVRRSRALMSTTELDLRPAPPLLADGRPAGTSDLSPTSAIPLLDRHGSRGGPTHPTQAVPQTVQQDAQRAVPQTSGGASTGQAPTRRRRRWLVPVLLVVLLALGGGGATWWFAQGPGARTTVPTVAGQPRLEALTALEGASLRGDVVESFDEAVPAGTVLSQEPGPGSEVPRLTTVTVTVSKGQERYAAPALVATSVDAAAATLSQGNLAIGARTDTFSETVETGTIISQDPAAGAPLARGAAVAVTVSKGRAPITVTDVTGKRTADARQALESIGLSVVEGPTVNSDTVPEGVVVSQAPRTGIRFKGDPVTIVASKGPVLVAVPATVGTQRDQAAALLKAAGLNVAYTEILGGFFGTVRDSNPPAGSMVRKGSTITLTIV